MSPHPSHRIARGRPAFVLALSLTAGYAVVELVGGLWTGSLALLGDAGHMFSDAGALAVAALAARLARRPPGARHTYGWQRAEVIGALLNSLLMLAIIVLLAVEAVQRLIAPREIMASGVIVIALIGMLVNGVCAYLLSRGEPDLNARAALLHVIGDLVSSFAVLIAGAVIYATGWLPIDPILSLVICALILATTLKLLRDALHVLMEGVPPSVELGAIGKALATVPGVVSVHDLHVWSLTPDSVALSAHVELEDLQRWPVILAAASEMLRGRFGIEHATLQPEIRGSTAAPQSAVVRLHRGIQRPMSDN
ncbi:MAG: cation transporter [Betaproteobacteria bacterium]|nr:cation transporter [Betaproteobacteria bacterium]